MLSPSGAISQKTIANFSEFPPRRTVSGCSSLSEQYTCIRVYINTYINTWIRTYIRMYIHVYPRRRWGHTHTLSHMDKLKYGVWVDDVQVHHVTHTCIHTGTTRWQPCNVSLMASPPAARSRERILSLRIECVFSTCWWRRRPLQEVNPSSGPRNMPHIWVLFFAWMEVKGKKGMEVKGK